MTGLGGKSPIPVFDPAYAESGPPSQVTSQVSSDDGVLRAVLRALWSLGRRLGWTWQRNPNYRHARYCRRRRRREHLLAWTYQQIKQYVSEAPRYLPFSRLEDWPEVGIRTGPNSWYLPAEDWPKLKKRLQNLKIALNAKRLDDLKRQADLPGPPCGWAVLGPIVSVIGGPPLRPAPI